MFQFCRENEENFDKKNFRHNFLEFLSQSDQSRDHQTKLEPVYCSSVYKSWYCLKTVFFDLPMMNKIKEIFELDFDLKEPKYKGNRPLMLSLAEENKTNIWSFLSLIVGGAGIKDGLPKSSVQVVIENTENAGLSNRNIFTKLWINFMKKKYGENALHNAAILGDAIIIEKLLESGYDLRRPNDEGITPLILAIQHSHLESAILLLRWGSFSELGTNEHLDPTSKLFDVITYVKDNKGDYLLHFAVETNRLELIDIIRKNIDCKNKNGATGLHMAAEAGKLDCVKILIEKGLSTEDKQNDGETPLHLASKNNHLASVEYLLKMKADIEAVDKDQHTPLHLASVCGHIQIAQLLISKGANLEVTDKDGSVPLHFASKNGHLETIIELLDKGSEKEVKDSKGQTPLHWASCNGHLDAVKYLCSEQVNKEAKQKSKKTPLHSACLRGHLQVVSYLLSCDANIEARDSNSYTALHMASQVGHFQVAEELLRKGADYEARNIDHMTPLHIAYQFGHCKVVKVLLDAGADIEAEQIDNRTALQLACYYGHLDVVKLLLASGAISRSSVACLCSPINSTSEI